MSQASSQQLVERMKFYWADLKCRKEDGQPITVDLGPQDGIVEFRFNEAIDFSDFGDDGRYYRFDLFFKYKSVAYGDNTSTNVSISLDAEARRVELVVDPHLDYGGEEVIDKVPLVASYSDKNEGKKIILRPREFDDPKISEEEVLLAEVLFNEVTAKLGLIPETPFDFAPVRMYIRKQKETHDKVLELWGELSANWYKIEKAWDNHLSD